MKKIILIIIILLVTSCYDYKEINNLAFVNTIGIEYDNKYHLYFEILNDEASENNKAYVVSADGITLSEAFNNIALKFNKIPYYAHLKVVIIDNSILNKIDEINDFFTRNPDIRNKFYLVLTTKNKTKEIINYQGTNNDNNGNIISNLIENNSNNSSYTKNYNDFLYRICNPNLYAFINVINIKDNDINLDGIMAFKDDNFYKIINTNILNTLLNNQSNLIITKNDITIKVYENKIKYKITKNKICFTIISNAQITENNSNIDLTKRKNYTKLNKIFSEEYNSLITDFIKNNYMLLDFQDKYYKKYHKTFDNISIIVNSKINVNKKGMIFNIYEK